MAQAFSQELSAQDVTGRHRRARRTLHEAMSRPTLIHRPTPDELTVRGGKVGYTEALGVLRRALEDGALMAALRRMLTSGQAHALSDLQVLERLARGVADGRMIIYSRPPLGRPRLDAYTAANDRDYRSLLAGFVGSIPHMYLGSRGVTVGVGKILPTPASALAVRFSHRRSIRLATPAEIMAAYVTVQGAIGRRPASAYRDLTDLDLALGEIDRLLTQDLELSEDGCRGLFRGWDRFPAPAQLALLDMVYSLGEGRAITAAERQSGQHEQGIYQYHRLREAVAREDWIAASRECHRVGIPAARDNWTREKFREAAHVAPPQPERHRALNL